MPSSNGKFLISVPKFSKQRGRVRTVGQAVVKMAEMLGADIEVSQRTDVLSVWVYYKNDEKDEVLLYRSIAKNGNLIRNLRRRKEQN